MAWNPRCIANRGGGGGLTYIKGFTTIRIYKASGFRDGVSLIYTYFYQTSCGEQVTRRPYCVTVCSNEGA